LTLLYETELNDNHILHDVKTVQEFFYDLNVINKIIAFGPAKSFCY